MGAARERFYARPSLNVESYDARHPVTMEGTPLAGDVAFYRSLAERTGGPVLELACGTGRVAFALADAGFAVTGLDLSEPMLAVARRKLERASGEVRPRLELVHGDMTAFALGRSYALALVAFRSFQALETADMQRACLQCVARHLQPGGLLAIDLFDPRLDLCVPDPPDAAGDRPGGTLPNGNQVAVTVTHRSNDPVAQVMTEHWRFAELDPGGSAVRVEDEELVLRWTYRHEMRHLLELTGFAVEAEYSSFDRSAPAYGKELIFVAQAAP